MTLSVGSKIYKMKYIGDELRPDKSRIYTITEINKYNSDQGIHTAGVLDDNRCYEIDYYDFRTKMYYSYTESVGHSWCCYLW